MSTITFTIDNGKIERIKAALKGLYPIPMTNTEPYIPLFTDSEWAKECVRRWIIRQVARYEQLQGQEAIVYSEDDTLIT